MEIHILFGRFLVRNSKISEDEQSEASRVLSKIINSLKEFKEKGTMEFV